MKLKMKILLIISLALLFVCCASIRRKKQREEYQKYLDSQIDNMTYDQALINWGEPLSLTEGDEIFIATWGAENTIGATMPIGSMWITVPVKHGWKLQLSFDKNTRKMVFWKFENW